jgi:lipoyl-dependent peroxiredoxin
MKRKATARWEGSGKEGKGVITTESTVLKDTPYSASSRFAEGIGTNPEELIGAALSGCFSMKLAFIFQEAGITPDSIDTEATVVFENGHIPEIQLTTRVKAPGLDQEKLEEMANNARENCPISKSLKSNVSLQAELG